MPIREEKILPGDSIWFDPFWSVSNADSIGVCGLISLGLWIDPQQKKKVKKNHLRGGCSHEARPFAEYRSKTQVFDDKKLYIFVVKLSN